MTGNLSRNIDPIDCEKCGGLCCQYFDVWYDDRDGNIKLSEMKRYQNLKTVGEMFEIIRVPEHGGFWLRLHDPCKYLTDDNKCEIHESEDRPLLCRLYPYPNTSKRDCPYITRRRKQ